VNSSDAIAVTASTGASYCRRIILTAIWVGDMYSDILLVCIGIAACNIGGVTVHSFAGIGLGVESAEVLATKVMKNRKASSRWLRTKVLIIDEGIVILLAPDFALNDSAFCSIHDRWGLV